MRREWQGGAGLGWRGAAFDGAARGDDVALPGSAFPPPGTGAAAAVPGAPAAALPPDGKLARLARMSLAEIAFRSRQESLKWLERLRSERLGPPPARSPLRLAPAALAALREGWRGRFLAGPGEVETPELVRRRTPDAAAAVVARADALCEGRFDLLGYRGLSFGSPIDWHLDPVAGRRSPRLHWSRLNPLDPAAVGDSKVIWELSRHQWLVTLGQAYRLTGDERYACSFAGAVWSWLDANPPGIGLNWASSLELALRMLAWCWALTLFHGSPSLTPELFAAMLGSAREHGRRVARHLSYYFSPNTHLTGEALGLFCLGVALAALPEARRWRATGAQILVAQSERQVLDDGVYFEQATVYQRYTAEMYLHFLLLARRAGWRVPERVSVRAQRLLDFLLAVRAPGGCVPQIGDSDGGWLLPLAERAPGDLGGVFSTAAAVFGRADYAWAAGALAPETLWTLGAYGRAAFEALAPAPPVGGPSRVFPRGGYVVMRGGWEADAHQLVFDAGPLGCPVSGGHGHADLLSVQCAAFGRPCLVDPGTYVYTGAPEWRAALRGSGAHSTLLVDGREQARPTGAFAWAERPAATLRRWSLGAHADHAEGEHAAYARRGERVVHRRRVLFVKPRLWLLLDEVEGGGEHAIELRFQFAPGELRLAGDWARWPAAGGPGLLLRCAAALRLQAELRSGATRPIRGWVCDDYGQRRPAPSLGWSARGRLPIRVLSVLVPVADAAAAPPELEPVHDGLGPIGVRWPDRREVRFDDEATWRA